MNAAINQSSFASRVQAPSGGSDLDLWFVSDRTIPVVTMRFAFKGGSAQDPADKPGVAHLLASMLTEGEGPTEGRSIQRLLSEKAIELSFWTERDALHGQMRVLARYADYAFDLLGDLLSKPSLDETTFKRIRARIAHMLEDNRHRPVAAAADRFREMAYGDHPYGIARHGSLDSLRSITQTNLAEAHSFLLARDGLSIAIVGAIDADHAVAATERAFGTLPSVGQRQVIPRMSVGRLGAVEVVEIAGPQSALFMGRPALQRSDPEFAAARIVNHCFGGGMLTSRLFHEVRRKRGLAYSIASSLETFEKTALLLVATSTRNDRVKVMLDVVEDVVDVILKEGLSDNEVEQAKTYLIGADVLRFSSSIAIASQLLDARLAGQSSEWFEAKNRAIAQVTPDSAREAAEKLFGDRRFVVAIAGQPNLREDTNSDSSRGTSQ